MALSTEVRACGREKKNRSQCLPDRESTDFGYNQHHHDSRVESSNSQRMHWRRGNMVAG